MTCTFYRERELTLMLCAGPCYTTGNDLALFGGELHQALFILVIDVYIAALAEPADFPLLDFFYW